MQRRFVHYVRVSLDKCIYCFLLLFLAFEICRDIDKKIVELPEIRETGEYIAELKLHPEVTARVRLNVFAN